MINSVFVLLVALLLSSCENKRQAGEETDITIYFINDNHSQINNFSKVKDLVDEAEENGHVIIVSSGDMFSGNPVVDFHEENGYPVIDLMNRVGFDVAALGNHEFDYGQDILEERIDHAEFDMLCVNMDSECPALMDVPGSITIEEGDLRISFAAPAM